jgi:nucleoside-triphosphatase THEP1
MLLVGVTGPVGSGKTSLLLQLATWFQQQHKGVEGFLAIGENRRTSNQGADCYRLQMIASGRDLLYATRDNSKTPPYVFEIETERLLQEWAGEMNLKGAPALIILDEFGPLEVSGRGHAKLWDSIKSSNAPLVVIAMRSGLVPDIEQVLHIQFDVCIDAQGTEAWNKLRTVCAEHDDWRRIGSYGAAAGSFEASVGTALHTAKIPFRGIALSSVQSMVMTYAGDGLGTRSKIVWVPFIAAGMKALSPSGNRLNPMLAISVQGILFTGATILFGWNVAGIVLGGFLVGAWAAAQGVLLQLLFVGGDLVKVYDVVLQWIAHVLHLPPLGLIGLLVVWSSLAGIFSSMITLYTYTRRHRTPERLQRLLAQGAAHGAAEESKRSWKSTFKQSVRDLTRPVFWMPIVILMVLIFVSGSSVEDVFWIAVRASTIAMVFFSLARAFDPRSFLNWLRKRGYWGPAYAFRLVFLPNRKDSISK